MAKKSNSNPSAPKPAPEVVASEEVVHDQAAAKEAVQENADVNQAPQEGIEGEVKQPDQEVQKAAEEAAAEQDAPSAEPEQAPEPEDVTQPEVQPEVQAETKANRVTVQTAAPQRSSYHGHAQAPLLEYFDRIAVEGTDIQKQALLSISNYCNQTRPKVIVSEKDFIEHQRTLFSNLRAVAEKKEYDDFRQGWNIYQKYFQAHHDVNGVFGNNSVRDYTALSEYRIFQTRMGAWKGREEEYGVFRIIITILRTCRNPETAKQEARTIDFDRLAGTRFISEVGINNLKQFYGV